MFTTDYGICIEMRKSGLMLASCVLALFSPPLTHVQGCEYTRVPW